MITPAEHRRLSDAEQELTRTSLAATAEWRENRLGPLDEAYRLAFRAWLQLLDELTDWHAKDEVAS